MSNEQNTRASAATVAEPSATTVLPDGSAFSVVSMPLPKDHWLYAPRTYEKSAETPDELPEPILTHSERETVVAAIRYAVRGATMCGKEADFDPDALVQNAVFALCGPFTRTLSMGERIGHATEQTAQQQDEPVADERMAWEYSFIHSSATGRPDEKVGPCLTYDKAQAFGVGCVEQRAVRVSAAQLCQRAGVAEDAIANAAHCIAQDYLRDPTQSDRDGIAFHIRRMFVMPAAAPTQQQEGGA